MDATTCAICMDAFSEGNRCTLECQHAFHPQCIVDWFRRSRCCPLCRGTESKWCVADAHARAKYLRQRVRMRGAPPKLIRLVCKWREAEQKALETRKTRREFESLHTDILRELKVLKKKEATARTAERRSKRIVGVFNDASCPVPLLLPKR